MIVGKKFHNDLKNIVMLGDCIELHYKESNKFEKLDRTVRMDTASIHGATLYFRQASENHCPSKLNLNINRSS